VQSVGCGRRRRHHQCPRPRQRQRRPLRRHRARPHDPRRRHHVGAGFFVVDADPATTTDPLDADSDDGGIPDGEEDTNGNGRIDAGEGDPNVGADDTLDLDGDGLDEAGERRIGTDPRDADSDDDGVSDGDEPDFDEDTDGDGRINALDPDSDGDGLKDGTELGVTTPDGDTDVGAGNFVADADPGGADADADGIGDLVDNCPDVDNGDQEDADDDGTGDACDDDADGDGYADRLSVAGGGLTSCAASTPTSPPGLALGLLLLRRRRRG